MTIRKRQQKKIKANIFRILALVTALVLLSISVAGCFPGKAGMDRVKEINAKAAQEAELKKLAEERAKPSTAEKLTDTTKDLQETLGELAKGKGKMGDIRAGLMALDRLDGKLQKEFRETENKIAKIGAKKAQRRHEKFVSDYEEKMDKLTDGLAQVAASETGAERQKEAEKLSTYVTSLIPEEKHQPLGTDLPHRNVDYQAGEPVLGSNISPAYMAESPSLEPSSLPRDPTSDDLTETVDTKQTEAIQELAESLDKDPIKIYEFVRNTIVYEPYYGSRKGAQETLWERGGNDIDQANLLIALFRYSNIPSRYVSGVVEIPIDKAMNWVGVEKPYVAAQVFTAAGIPTKAIVRGGVIDALQIEHTWTEAYVSYSRYRGVDEGVTGHAICPPPGQIMRRQTA